MAGMLKLLGLYFYGESDLSAGAPTCKRLFIEAPSVDWDQDSPTNSCLVLIL